MASSNFISKLQAMSLSSRPSPSRECYHHPDQQHAEPCIAPMLQANAGSFYHALAMQQQSRVEACVHGRGMTSSASQSTGRIITKNANNYYQCSNPYGTAASSMNGSHYPQDPDGMSLTYSQNFFPHGLSNAPSATYQCIQNDLHVAKLNSCINQKFYHNHAAQTMVNTQLNPHANDFIPTSGFNLAHHSQQFVRDQLERQRYNDLLRTMPTSLNNNHNNNHNSSSNNNNNNNNFVPEKEEPRRENISVEDTFMGNFEWDMKVKKDRKCSQLFSKPCQSNMRQLWPMSSPTSKKQPNFRDAEPFDLEVHNEEKPLKMNTWWKHGSLSLDYVIHFDSESEAESDDSVETLTVSPLITLPPSPSSQSSLPHSSVGVAQDEGEPRPRDRSASIVSMKSTSSRFKEQLYKTEMCRYMVETNFCKYGDQCRFAHSEKELRTIGQRANYRTEECHEFSTGMCYFGWRCWFRHKKTACDDDAFHATMIDLFFNPFLREYLDAIIKPKSSPQ